MTIHKEIIPIIEDIELRLPRGAKLLCVQVQRDIPRVWYSFDEREEGTEIRHLKLQTTGRPFIDLDLKYLGSFQLSGGDFVGHIYHD